MIVVSDLTHLQSNMKCAQIRYSNAKEFVAIADALEIMNDFKVIFSFLRRDRTNKNGILPCRAMFLEQPIVVLCNVNMVQQRSSLRPINNHGKATDEHSMIDCDRQREIRVFLFVTCFFVLSVCF